MKLHRTDCEQSAALLRARCSSWRPSSGRRPGVDLFLLFFVWTIALGLVSQTAIAASSKEEKKEASPVAQSLDEQVQEIKSDVLAIAAELSNLEERLLYPSDTQIAVFVAFEPGESVSLDAARISIDGELVAHHIYSWKELEALGKGGVQRIYTGNVPTGKHRIEVAIVGRRSGEKSFEKIGEFDFEKEVGPKLVGVTLAADASGEAKIGFEGW